MGNDVLSPRPPRAGKKLGISTGRLGPPPSIADATDSLPASPVCNTLTACAVPERIVKPDLLALELPNYIGDPAHEMRLVETPDRRKTLRRSWLDQFLNCSQQYLYQHGSLRFLSQAKEGFAILFVSSDDLRRLHAIIRYVRSTLPSKLIVPVLSHVSTASSIGLLERGADEVFHCDMDRGEAIRRVYALRRRLEWREDHFLREGAKKASFESLLSSLTRLPLTRKEQKVLLFLAGRQNRFAPNYVLLDQADIKSSKSLKVIISRLRGKLAEGVMITNQSGLGYALFDLRIKAVSG